MWKSDPYFETDDKFLRPLTCTECERLQTLPDDYTKCLGQVARKECIGNGWTVDVIAEIFKGIGG